MSDSILVSTKKVLGISEDYEAFDQDIIMHINSVFSTLDQLGIGPTAGFMIEDKTSTWRDLLGDDLRLNQVRSYVYLRVRLLFDPPATSYLISSLDTQRKEMEWRMSVHRENESYQDPTVTHPDE